MKSSAKPAAVTMKTPHQQLQEVISANRLDPEGKNKPFYTRLVNLLPAIRFLFDELYGKHPQSGAAFQLLLDTITEAYLNRDPGLQKKDEEKLKQGQWFLSHQITGMSLYVDRFCGNLKQLNNKLPYFHQLGVNLLHLMPLFESPEGESDGGYAVSNFRKVDKKLGDLIDLERLIDQMHSEDMYVMMDIVLNHTSHHHEWALKAKAGDPEYQDHYHFFPNRSLPDIYERTMPEIFPESAPGSFTLIPQLNKWVMTVFHTYQWDLNYSNPAVLVKMLDTIFFYANLGVDVLRIDAPAFIWKQVGTSCQNLPEAHLLLRLIKLCVQVSSPGMALLGEAIVAPQEIMKYFGTGDYTAMECDMAYNATHMALQWDALATGDTQVMLAAQPQLLQKPLGTTWINYTRCHDDIGLGYEDSMIEKGGYAPYPHRKFLKEYYAGHYPGTPAKGALFSVNPRTQDARISGSLASLCGLEKALEQKDPGAIQQSIQKILLMQAHSFFLGGIPMLFYGDEMGYTNDYSYLKEPGKSYDNRWMHRPLINWKKAERLHDPASVESRIFSGTQRLISIRHQLPALADRKNIQWISAHNKHVTGYLRNHQFQKIYCLFNFSPEERFLTWYAFKEHGHTPSRLYDHWTDHYFQVGLDHEYLVLAPYGFHVFEVR